MSDAAPSPFLFLVGCPRSGTTLLQRMLDSHGQLAVVNDSGFIYKSLKAVLPDWKRRLAEGDRLPLTPELVDYVRGHKRFKRLELDDAAVTAAATGAATWSEFVGRLYAAFARRRGKRHGGEKTPDYVRRMPALHGMFPRAKFVHIIRDGRDVALSASAWAEPGNGPRRFELFEEEPVATTAMWWAWQVSSGRRAGEQLGPEFYRELRYEQLIDDPEGTLQGLCEFLGLPFDPAMLRYHEGRASYEPRQSAKSAWLPPTRGLRDWRSQMAIEDVLAFESLAGELLGELGYERTGESVPEPVARKVERCRRWWHSESAGV
ncbi:MAG: sulfotransferase [Planctomycetota bacterium]